MHLNEFEDSFFSYSSAPYVPTRISLFEEISIVQIPGMYYVKVDISTKTLS